MRRTVVASAAVVTVGTFGMLSFLIIRGLVKQPRQAPDESSSYEQILEPYLTIPPELLHYRMKSELVVSLRKPTGIASAADDTLYVCGDNALLVLDAEGNERSRFSFEARPLCVTVDDRSIAYVGTEDHVEVLNIKSGERETWASLGEKSLITSVAISQDFVFLADAGNRQVFKFDRNGRLLDRWGGDFIIPSPYFDIAVDTEERLWVVDPGRHTLHRYAMDGKRIDSWGTYSMEISGFSGCCNPVHIAPLANGSVVTSEKGLGRVKVYASNGDLESVVAGPLDFEAYPDGSDLAALSNGDILVLIPERSMIRIYERK